MTAPHWAGHFLGRPYEVGSSGPETFDCWGLVRAVMSTRAGIDLPEVGIAEADIRGLIQAFETHAERARWREVTAHEPNELDAVLMATARRPVHVGIWLNVGTGRVLHAARPLGVVAQAQAQLASSGYRVVARFRHATLD